MPSKKIRKARVKKNKFIKPSEASEYLDSILDLIKEGVGFVLHVYYEDDEPETFVIARDEKTFKTLCGHFSDKDRKYIA